MQNYLGKQIDRYRIIEQLGMGGMAVVYKAYDIRLEREVALKLIRIGEIPESQHERLMKRFEREAKAQARFSHPNIVPVHDYGEVDGLPYLVMSYVAGGTLKERTGEPMPVETALEILAPVADALDYAHKHGVIHRDIKPSNILFNDDGQPMLADFGIAKVLETEEETLTGTGLGVGTPEYMAPEQWHGKVSTATDQYALGVVLYELLTGKKPHTADTPAAVAIIQATEPIISPRKLVSDIPDFLEKVLFKVLAKDPQDRFASMKDLRNVLASYPGHKNIPVLASASMDKFDEKKIGENLAYVMPINSEGETVDHLAVSSETTNLGNYPFEKTNERSKGFPKWVMWALIGVIVICLVGGITGVVWGGSQLFERINGNDGEINEDFELAAVTLDNSVEVGDPESNFSSSDNTLPTLTQTESMTLTASISQTIPLTQTASPTETVILTATWTPSFGIGSEIENEIDGAALVYVPAGEFIMGTDDPDSDENERPAHDVYLDGYWIYKYEVTNAQYRSCIQEGACTGNLGLFPENQYPAVKVDWYSAQAYCQWAGGRLPTEAEWEKAARGTDERKYTWGQSSPSCNLANFYGCAGNTKPVGSYPDGVSPYGALDMAGNVWEWVADWYSEDYSNAGSTNPTGPSSGTYKMMRGGSYLNNGWYMRVTDRIGTVPNSSDFILGFRCAHNE